MITKWKAAGSLIEFKQGKKNFSWNNFRLGQKDPSPSGKTSLIIIVFTTPSVSKLKG